VKYFTIILAGIAWKGIRYKNWKLVLPHPSNSYAGLQGKSGKPGSITRVQVPLALYNLTHDPAEAHDVQTLFPEMVKLLMGFAEEARLDLGDDLTNRTGRNIR
jgi:hypothetical protein